MKINKVERVVIDTHILHHSLLLSSLLSFKKQLRVNAATNPPSAEAQKQFYYAAISTQDFSTYYISVVRLPHKPSEIWQDINNISEIKKKQDLLSQLRVAAACFARLLIQSRTIAEEGNLRPTDINMTKEHSYEDIMSVLQYLNENNSSIPPYRPCVTEFEQYQGHTQLNKLLHYIPVLSPLQLTHKMTMQVGFYESYRQISEQITYIELLKALDHLRERFLTPFQKKSHEYRGNYSLHLYPALESSDTTDTCHTVKLLLSHVAPMEILSSLDNTDDLNANIKSIIRFVKRFVTTKAALKDSLTPYTTENLIGNIDQHTELSKALRFFIDAPKEQHQPKAIEDLRLAYNASAYMVSDADFIQQSSIVKVLFSYSIHSKISVVEFLNNINSIHKNVQFAINSYQSQYYYYVGISQEYDNLFHLLLVASNKSTEALCQTQEVTDSLSPVEQNVIHAAYIIQQVEIKARQLLKLPSCTSTRFIDSLNVLNTSDPDKIYCSDSISFLEENYFAKFIQISPLTLSELDLEKKAFITQITPIPCTYDIASFSTLNLLDKLSSMIYVLKKHTVNRNHQSLNRPLYYYPCLARKSQSVLYIHMVISHKAPEEVVNIQTQAIKELSKEEQGILLFGNVYLEGKKAASNGNDFCQILQTCKHSESDFMDFLTLLNNQLQLNEDILDKAVKESRKKTILIGLVDILPIIPFLPANRLDAYDDLSLYSRDLNASCIQDHPQQIDRTSRASHPPPLRYQQL